MKTTISIDKKTRDELAALGNKDSSFNQIVLELIKKERQRTA